MCCLSFAEWVASILVSGATFKIKLAHVKAVFQSVHGFLGVKSVSKNNMKLFCVEFASQVSLEAVFLVELTSSVCLATLKIAKFLVVSESGSFSAAVVLHNMPLGVSAADIKTAPSVFGVITHVVLKPAGIWQYVVIHFKNLVAVTSALKHWLILTKLVNFSPGCTAFEISDMVSQVGADLDLAVVKTGTLRKCHIWWETSSCWHCFQCQEISHLAMDCKVASLLPFKAPKMFKPHFVGFLSYAKASVPPVLSEFPLLVAAAFSVTLVSLESDLAKLSVLVESIVKSVGFMVKVFEQFVNNNLVSSFALGLRVNKVLVYMSTFSRAVGKLEHEVVTLKTECGFKDIDMSGFYANAFKTTE
ncbi:hypothetical protein G9A89_023985 [Geosiphon pyriformis]|nr:hypothetical protein G9A89_023985 [Geosiphon pyriformis]